MRGALLLTLPSRLKLGVRMSSSASNVTGNKRPQASWSPPERKAGGTLKLYNGLTRQKEEFVPGSGRNGVTWYNCGPTVYDASHMGHARTYLTFDILRRILTDYFGYDIFYVMNITDIDDKIVKRARKNHLFENYSKKGHSFTRILEDVSQSSEFYEGVMKKTEDPDKKLMQEKQLKALSELIADITGRRSDSEDEKVLIEDLLKGSKDLLSDWLDSKYSHEVTGNNEVFTELPRYWEEMFHKDMAALNIAPPDVLTRVSEYIPEIVLFIDGIISKGYGYVSEGSVYFDVAKFANHPDHYYAKLVPESYGNSAALQDGEGDLSGDKSSEKRNKNDFALWKDSKQGEPSWDSPWGKGRPGWHIECSAMASELLGSTIDIHTGGCDLKFPHHDNELAQSEAYFDNKEWIRYFLHSGHLTISGCKMSKSLKNFITIQEVLKTYTAKQLRLTFLLHSWKDTLDYSDRTLGTARNYEKTLTEYFLNIKHILRINDSSSVSASASYVRWTSDEIDLNKNLIDCQASVHEAFCDNVDTKSALDAIRSYIGFINNYIDKKSTSGGTCHAQALRKGAEFVTKIFKIVGVIPSFDAIGFPSGSSSVSSEEVVMPYLNSFADFRDNVRKCAREIKATDILKECDRLRDDVLPELGVRLEDKENEPTVIKLVDKEELLREKKQKKDLEEMRRLEKEKKKAAMEAKKAADEAQKKIDPKVMFLEMTDKYSAFDERGLPTHDANGEKLSQAQTKKLQKIYNNQEAKYTAYIKQQ